MFTAQVEYGINKRSVREATGTTKQEASDNALSKVPELVRKFKTYKLKTRYERDKKANEPEE